MSYIDDLITILKKLTVAIEKDYNNYKQRVIKNSEIDGVTVSTAYTSDMGYETAIIDVNGTYPVERYSDKEHAIIGHIKWCVSIIGKMEITKLGYDSLIKKEKIVLRRK